MTSLIDSNWLWSRRRSLRLIRPGKTSGSIVCNADKIVWRDRTEINLLAPATASTSTRQSVGN